VTKGDRRFGSSADRLFKNHRTTEQSNGRTLLANLRYLGSRVDARF